MISNKNNNSETLFSKNVNSIALSSIKKIVSDKSVLYIATTYLEYLRVQQELSILNQYASNVKVIVSESKYYIVRLLYVYYKCIFNFQKTDVVYIGFAPQLVLPFLKWRFFGKKVIIDFFISLHDTMVMDRKKFSEKSLVAKILKYFDRVTLRKAELVLSDTQAHAQYFIEDLGCDKNKIQTLYLNADSNYYYPKNIEKPEYLRGKYIVLYFGSVLPLQGVDVILEAINICKNKNIFYIMIGPLDNKNCINKNVKFIKWLSQEKLSDYIAYADLCLAGHFCAKIDKASRTIAGKTYIYEAMKKKIILGDNRANRERYPQCYNPVDFVEMGSPIELNNIIMKNYLENKNEQ